VRDEYEAELGGVRLHCMSEVLERAEAIVGAKNHA